MPTFPFQLHPSEQESHFRPASHRSNLHEKNILTTYRPQPSTREPDYGRLHPVGITSSFLPPPNITGPLHIGHAFNQSLTDVFLRSQSQSSNCRALWVAGLDHAGIASQIVVNRILVRKEPNLNARTDCLSENVWEWYFLLKWTTRQQSEPFQLSFDWLRGHFTFSTKASNCLREVLSQLDIGHLVYRTEHLVNWDATLGTVLSDLEVEHQTRPESVWYLKYQVTTGPNCLVVCTARPETIASDSAIIVDPQTWKGSQQEGNQLVIPTTGRPLSIVSHPRISTDVGSRTAPPTHPRIDSNSQLRQSPRTGRTKSSSSTSWTRSDSRSGQVSGKERWLMLLELKFRGFLLYAGKQKVRAPFSSRTSTPAALVLMKQWFLSLKADVTLCQQRSSTLSLSGAALEAVRTRRTRFLPSTWLALSCRWLRASEDWCLSRQLLWGHRIPSRLSETGGDVLDTWFSSAIIPITASQPAVRFSDPRSYLPFSALFTGHDIVRFWVARMLMVSSYCTGRAPFSLVYVHGLFYGEDGTKMSKSRGNVISPSDLLRLGSKAETGDLGCGLGSDADSFRSTLISLASPSWGIVFDRSKLGSYRNFLRKVNNVGTFLTARWLGLKARLPAVRTFPIGLAVTMMGRWMVAEFQETAVRIGKNQRRIRLDRQLEDVYELTKKKCCDRFIEHIKASTETGTCQPKNSDLLALSVLFNNLLLLLLPIAPSVTAVLLNENHSKLHRLGRFSPLSHLSTSLTVVNSLRDAHNERAVQELVVVSKILNEAAVHIPSQRVTLLTDRRHEHLVEASIASHLVEIYIFTNQQDLTTFCLTSCKPAAGSPQVMLLFGKDVPNQVKVRPRQVAIRRLLSVPYVCHSSLGDVLASSSQLSFLLGLN